MPKLVLVPTPIGNLGDITLRAVEVLRACQRVACEDTRRTGLLLKHLSIEKPLVALHAHNEHQRVPQLLDGVVRADETLAYCSDAGTPGVSDPGFLLVREAIARDMVVECLPGATAFVPALVVSGLPMDRFVFEGFLPQKKGRQTRLKALVPEERTLILYEAPHRLPKLLAELAEHLGSERPACVCRELTKLHEEARRGTLAELQQWYDAHPPKGECVVVVGGRP
jgi:16S rRNA (cytidine1402-2'-O)-methyltransferase